MTTSQYEGVADCIGYKNILNPHLEDAVQEFLQVSSGLPGPQIMPEGQFYKPIGEGGAFAFYRLEPPQNVNLLEKIELPDGEAERYTYSGELVIHVTFYGEHCRDIAQLVRDALSVNQTAHILSEVNLGVIDGQILGHLYEPDGAHYIERTDLQIRCNYTYSRDFAIKSFKAASIKFLK